MHYCYLIAPTINHVENDSVPNSINSNRAFIQTSGQVLNLHVILPIFQPDLNFSGHLFDREIRVSAYERFESNFDKDFCAHLRTIGLINGHRVDFVLSRVEFDNIRHFSARVWDS